jgi:FAD/FMN-containing dehydrogenase
MDVSRLSSSFPSIVFLPESAEYETRNGSYFAAFENEITPLCIIRPRDTQELGQLLKYLTATSHIEIAIRCGGHTPWGGAANAENGITIDLENFRGIEIDSVNNTATFGARETWGDVYEKLGERGLSVVGGRVSKVAVGGLTLGSRLPLILSESDS